MAFSKHVPITLGTATLLLVIAALVTVTAYQQTAIQAEVLPESVPSRVTAGEGADPSGDVQIVSVQSVFSGNDKLAFVHECQGTVVTPPKFSYMRDDAAMPSYCVGKNFLSVKDMGGAEVALVSESTSASAEDAAILGYDLTADATKALTTERACAFDNGPSQDVEGNPFPMWGPTSWTSNDTFTAVLLGTDGKWEQVDGTY